MTRHLIGFVILTAALGLLGVFAMAQAPAPEGSAGHDDHHPGESVAEPDMPAGHMDGDMKDMMAKMPADMMMCCRMLMNTVVSPSDPSAILALKDQLKLTAAQTTQLEAINMEAQDKAAAVLNADQKKTLDALPQSPQTMKDMHEQMMGQMKEMMGAKTGDQQMNCPMMQGCCSTSMMPDQTGPTTQPEADAPAAAAEPDDAAHQ